MDNIAVIGLQWGDEGKGKVVDYLARDFSIDARFQGGSNAGHTVHAGGEKFVFHLIPCGILNPGVTGIIGAGCVFDPVVFLQELDAVAARLPDPQRSIKISRYCHLIMPYHILLDKIKEEGRSAIGTTRKGIGPAYEDKYARLGIRVGDLLDPERFESLLRVNITRKNLILMDVYHAEPLSDDEIFRKYMEYAERLKPMIIDDTKYLAEALAQGKRMIFEGAQGVLLDVDFGTYPYVTSSHTVTGGASIGLGIPPSAVGRVIGVAKAYTTRVGQGPFPTEDTSAVGQVLRDTGSEFGATTGRPRRCGAFDASVVKYTARLAGVREIFLTKLDVLSDLDRIKLAVGYSNAPEFDPFIAGSLDPVYEELPGFKADISQVRTFDGLPPEAREYVRMIEHYTGLEVSHIGLGQDREAVIKR
jgi:adenylosuccinate synthase